MFCRNRIVNNRRGQRGGNHLILITLAPSKSHNSMQAGRPVQLNHMTIYTDALVGHLQSVLVKNKVVL